jgi:hypothetical protein
LPKHIPAIDCRNEATKLREQLSYLLACNTELRRRAVAPLRPHDDSDVLAKRNEKPHKALHGELPEVATQHFGDVRLLDAE